MKKAWAHPDIFLFPYMAKPKMVDVIKEQISSIHF